METGTRKEKDFLGEKFLPANAMYGIHTARALENFPLSNRPAHPELARAYGAVKLACAATNRALGVWDRDASKADAIERACRELADGLLTGHILTDALQGGAGTSLNMNVNEVLANACDILARHCVEGIEADAARCRLHVHTATATATALIPAIGHENACRVAEAAAENGASIRDTVLSMGLLSVDEFEALVTPEAVCRLGTPEKK